MKMLKLLLSIFLLTILFSCEFFNQSTVTTTNETITTTTSQTTTTENNTTTTAEEIDYESLWNNSIIELEEASNIKVKEGLEAYFTYNGHNVETHALTQIEIMNEGLMKLSIFHNYGFDNLYEETVYIKKEENENNYFYYQTLGNHMIKNEFDITLFDTEEADLIYEFTFKNGVNNLSLSSVYTENDMTYVELTRSFKLKDTPVVYQKMFDEEIELLFGLNHGPEYLNLDIDQTVIINQTNQSFESVSFDLSNLVESTINQTVLRSAENIIALYAYTFSNRNHVAVDSSNFDNVVLDDAPNGLELSFLTYPEYSTKETISGTLEYTDDIDYIKIHIEEDNKYQFLANQAVELYLLSEDGIDLNYGEKALGLNLEVGDYYLVVDSEHYNGDYEIEINNQIADDYGDSFADTHPIPFIDSNKIISGAIQYLGDRDIFEFVPSANDEVFYAIRFETDDNLEVYIETENDITLYIPEDGIIDFGVLLKENEVIYMYVESNTIAEYEFEVNLYNNANDVADSLDDVTIPTIEVGVPYEEAMYRSNEIDKDVFKFTIEDTDAYEFNVSVQVSQYEVFYGNVTLYDANKNFITDNFTAELTPGDYYLMIEDSGGILYQITIDKIIDDYETPTTYILSDSNNNFTGTIDYDDDIDEFVIEITESGFYQIVLSEKYSNEIQVQIKDAFNYILVNNYNTYIDTYSKYLYPGEYTVIVSGLYYPNGHDYSITFIKDTSITSDYGYHHQLDDSYLGLLTLGQEEEIRFDYNSDIDVYKLNIIESGTYVFSGKSIEKIVNSNGLQLNTNLLDDKVELTIGHYYFYFSNPLVSTQSFFIKLLEDDYEDDTTYSIELDTPITAAINHKDDIDQFEITITESGIYQYHFDSTSVELKIYDEVGNQLNYVYKYNANTIQLSNGTYYLKFAYRYIQAVPQDIQYTFNIGLYTTELDVDPDTPFLPSTMYRKLTLNDTLLAQIEHVEDYDVFLIEINSNGYYQITSDQNLSLILIISEDGELIMNYMNNYFFKGTYYLLIDNNEMIDYQITLSQ